MDTYDFDIQYDFKEKYEKFLNMKNLEIEQENLSSYSQIKKESSKIDT